MNWDPLLLGEPACEAELPRRIDELFAQQRSSWAPLGEGLAALSAMKSKEFTEGDQRIVVQANPGRRRSTYARVDPQSVARRPCFLCPGNIPPGERGLAFGDLVILPNPFPVASRHCTIPGREHLPQQLAGRIPKMLELARALGPGMLVFYNGPRCGASAPDHFHFQACDSAAVPFFQGVAATQPLQAVESFGRRVLISSRSQATGAARDLERILEAWSNLCPGVQEPMVNVLTLFTGDRYLTAVFPRSRHRPRCFFAEGDARVAVSPAALEMGGILVVAEADQFDRVDQTMARRIYQEVSLDPAGFEELVRAVP